MTKVDFKKLVEISSKAIEAMQENYDALREMGIESDPLKQVKKMLDDMKERKLNYEVALYREKMDGPYHTAWADLPIHVQNDWTTDFKKNRDYFEKYFEVEPETAPIGSLLHKGETPDENAEYRDKSSDIWFFKNGKWHYRNTRNGMTSAPFGWDGIGEHMFPMMKVK